MLKDSPTQENMTPASAAAQPITFEEFLVKYDGQHAEWFPDGTVLVHMAASERHQNILLFLSTLFNLYLSLRQLGRLMFAPFLMRLADDQPVREPDLMIVLDEHIGRIGSSRLNGAADVVIEIVSPESVERDYGAKFAEYEKGGVPEYWLIDPERQVARIYELRQVGENRVYQERPLDSTGRLNSGLLPGFALDPALLWRDELPAGMELLTLVGGMTGVHITRRDKDSTP